jgi:hypothetical protein
MIYRGPLRRCVEAADANYRMHGYEMLAITCSRAGHRYSLMRVEDLAAIPDGRLEESHRIVFLGTHRELLAFAERGQGDLFEEGEVGRDTA